MSDASSGGGNSERPDPEEARPEQPRPEQPEPGPYGEGQQGYGQPHGSDPYRQYGPPGEYGQQPYQGDYAQQPYQGEYGPQPYGPYGYQQGGYYGYQTAPDHPQSTMALVLGLIGLIGTMMCLVPSIVGPFAWFIGAKAKREIDASGGRLGGRGQAMTGYVLGIITTVLLVLVVLGLGALIAIGLARGFDDPSTLQY